MSQLVKIDESISYDPETGEEYLALGGNSCPTLDREGQLHLVSLKIGEVLKSQVLERMPFDWEVPELIVSEYFERLAAYYPVHTNQGDYFDFCDTLASRAMLKWRCIHSINGSDFLETWHIDDIKLEITYKQLLFDAADELVEFRTLQLVRKQLSRRDLAEHLKQNFTQQMHAWADDSFKSTVALLEAELSLCLTETERKAQLESEYRHRLEKYRKAAGGSLMLKHSTYGRPAWQCFTTEHLDEISSQFIDLYLNDCPDDIDFDRSVSVFWRQHKIKNETSELAADWLVVAWIKNQLTPEATATQETPAPPTSTPATTDKAINKFNPRMSLDEVKRWFEQLTHTNSKNGEPFLTQQQLDQFINTAFIGEPSTRKQSINGKNGDKGNIIGLFHLFYTRCASYYPKVGKGDPLAKTERYIRLLTDHFDNWPFEEVKNNFRSGGSWNKPA